MARGKIQNKKKKPNECASYYFVAHVDSTGEVTPLLLTEPEYRKAQKRAERNSEDVPEDYITFSQQHRNQ